MLGQHLLGLVLHLGEVDRDLAVGRIEGADLLPQQEIVELLVGLAQRLLPQLLELRALHQLEGDGVRRRLHRGGDRVGEEVGPGRQRVLDSLREGWLLHQTVRDLRGHRRLHRRVGGQRGQRGDERVGVEELVARVDDDHRGDGEETGQHEEHPRTDGATPPLLLALGVDLVAQRLDLVLEGRLLVDEFDDVGDVGRSVLSVRRWFGGHANTVPAGPGATATGP